jgi:hypothetical protein
MRLSPPSPYFGVNQVGLSASYGVAGRLGECRRRWPMACDAATDAKRLNLAYELGRLHGRQETSARPNTGKGEGV